MDCEPLEFKIGPQDLHRPHHSEALSFARGVIPLRGLQTATPKADWMPLPIFARLEEGCSDLYIAGIRVHAVWKVGIRQVEDRGARECLLQGLEGLQFLFGGRGKLFRVPFRCQLVERRRRACEIGDESSLHVAHTEEAAYVGLRLWVWHLFDGRRVLFGHLQQARADDVP